MTLVSKKRTGINFKESHQVKFFAKMCHFSVGIYFGIVTERQTTKSYFQVCLSKRVVASCDRKKGKVTRDRWYITTCHQRVLKYGLYLSVDFPLMHWTGSGCISLSVEHCCVHFVLFFLRKWLNLITHSHELLSFDESDCLKMKFWYKITT